MPARQLARALEGVADDPLDARPREAHLHARLLVGPAALAHARLRVHVLGVLAHDEEADLAHALVLERAEPLVVEDDRAEVHEEVEPAADADEHVPLHKPARRARVAERAQEDRVEAAQSVDHLRRHALAVVEIARGRPADLLALRLEPEALLAGVEDRERGRYDLGADAVAADDRELVAIHVSRMVSQDR